MEKKNENQMNQLEKHLTDTDKKKKRIKSSYLYSSYVCVYFQESLRFLFRFQVFVS